MSITLNIVNAKPKLEEDMEKYVSWKKRNYYANPNSPGYLPNVVVSMDSFNITTKTVDDKDFITYKSWSEKNKGESTSTIEDKFKRPNLDNIKNFSFITGTKFDRDYFKRIYPDIKRVIKHKNSDTVLYDNHSTKNLMYSKKYYNHVATKNKVIHCSNFTLDHHYLACTYKDKETESFCKGFIDSSYHPNNYGADILTRNNLDDLIGKMVHIDDLINKKSIKNEVTSLSSIEAETLLSQVKSSLPNTKTALETCIQYSNKYYLTKLLLFYTAHCVHGKIPYSGKLEYFKKHFSPIFVGRYTRTNWDIFDHISHICKYSEKQLKPNMETQIFKELIQSNVFIKCFSDVKFKINIQMDLPFSEIMDTDSSSEDVQISEFIV